jgi:hypothetical protein
LLQGGASTRKSGQEQIVPFDYPPGLDGPVAPTGYDCPQESATNDEQSFGAVQTSFEQALQAEFDKRLLKKRAGPLKQDVNADARRAAKLRKTRMSHLQSPRRNSVFVREQI